MRCLIGPKKVRRYASQLGRNDILTALTRGNTNHRVDLCLADGRILMLFRDGSTEYSTASWDVAGWNAKNGGVAK